jgi:hypothetical protein
MNSNELRALHGMMGNAVAYCENGSESLALIKARRIVASMALEAEERELREHRLAQQRYDQEVAAGLVPPPVPWVNGLPAREEVNGFIIERGDQ